MVTRCWPSKWLHCSCSENQCLRCCGVCLYWLPRVSMPLALLWGTLSHITYASDISNFFIRVLMTFLGTVAGLLAFIAYNQTWRVGPGFSTDISDLVASDPESQVSIFPNGLPECMQDCIETKHDGGVRFCSKCQCFKPDRTHHCRQCGVCVLRMDHHCPWFSTCIGFKNHKFFIQFMWYAWVLCVCADIVAIPAIMDFFNNELYNTRFIGINFVFYMMLASVFNLILLVFGGYTTYIAVSNRTTLESMEPSAYKTSLPPSQWRYRHPPTRESLGNIYDIGSRANMEQIMGSTWLEWLLPISPRLKLDGTWFPVNEELRTKAEERAQTETAMHQRKRQWHLSQETFANTAQT